MINDETFNYCTEFIPFEELEELQEVTGFGEDGILDDYLLSCSLAHIPANYETWSKYRKEQEAEAC